MKAVMVMFDSLNRHMLPPYGGEKIIAPNFSRLAEKTVTFDNFYAGSLPCMPARRELHTGRYNFLHRSWGPLEPFDDSMPEILRESGIYTHLITDHWHYFEDGGATYHNRYSSWDSYRGQEGDPWKAEVKAPDLSNRIGKHDMMIRSHIVNRKHFREKGDYPLEKCFQSGLEFLRKNHDQDNWFLQLECFDPHEPFIVPEEFRDLYPDDYDGPDFSWPDYEKVIETPEQIRHARNLYAALVTHCDQNLGKILDFFDEHNLWEDTMLIVNTDHGYLLAEHDWWAKVFMPWYNELAHIPFFIWDPRYKFAGQRRSALAATIDIPATLLEFFDVEKPGDMMGKSLSVIMESDAKIHDGVLFGQHGQQVNVTDGKYVYMRGPESADNAPLYNYTHMCTRMERRYKIEELQGDGISLAEPFTFTKNCKTLRIHCPGNFEIRKGIFINPYEYGSTLYDVENDPEEKTPLNDPGAEEKMIKLMAKLMKESASPPEQFVRLGLEEYV